MSVKCRLLLVSNRLPVTVERGAAGVTVQRSSGGLVRALGSLLRPMQVAWIGSCDGPPDEEVATALAAHPEAFGCELAPVFLDAEERALFYQGFSNEVVWPLFHDLQSRCNFDPRYWRSYRSVNQRFARAVLARLRGGAQPLVWVHDYHLMDVARELRAAGVRSRLAFFQHIPFPAPDIFAKLPWRAEVLTSLLEYDLLGFQTAHDVRNFTACLRRYLPRSRVRRTHGVLSATLDHRRANIAHFPISVDYRAFSARAATRQAGARAERVRLELGCEHIVLGVDRLDYTKGIPDRLRAFDDLLRRSPELHRKIVLLQIVVPSREEIPEYHGLRSEIEQLVSEINGRHSQPGWVPVQHFYRHLEPDDLLAYYRAADVCLVTPLRDGMNLVAKEYCAAKVDGNGVLVLSEFAGAAAQLANGALLVNPYHTEGVADAIARACHMPAEERQRRMRHMRHLVRRFDVFRWAEAFVSAAADRSSAASDDVLPGIARLASAAAPLH